MPQEVETIPTKPEATALGGHDASPPRPELEDLLAWPPKGAPQSAASTLPGGAGPAPWSTPPRAEPGPAPAHVAAPPAEGAQGARTQRPGEPDGALVPVPFNVVENLLVSSPLLDTCRKGDLGEIAPLARALECPAGSVLLDGTTPPRGLGLLVTGVASATSVDARTAAAEVMRAPDVFGESCLLAVHQRSPYVVVAQSDCRVLWLPLDAVQRLSERAPRFTPLLSQRASRRLGGTAFASLGLGGPTSSTPSMPALKTASSPAIAAATASNPAMAAVRTAPSHAAPGQLPTLSTPLGTPLGEPETIVPTNLIADIEAPYWANMPTKATVSSPAAPPTTAAAHLISPPAGPAPVPMPSAMPAFGAPPPLSPAAHGSLPPLFSSPSLGQSLPPPPGAIDAGGFGPLPSRPSMPAVQMPVVGAPPMPSMPVVGAVAMAMVGAAASASRVDDVSPPGIVRYVEIGDYDLQPSVLGLVPHKLIRQHRLLPLKLSGTRLTVGLVSPRNPAALAEVRRTLSSLELDVVAISADDYFQAIVRYKIDDPKHGVADNRRAAINPDTLFFDTAETDREAVPTSKVAGDEVVRLVNRIIASALEREASDIHLEPVSTGIRVRYRVHGSLVDHTEHVSAQLARPTVARVKIMAGLDITERRRPQDGRIGVKAGRKEVDLRVSTLPCTRGEKLVMRVLDSAASTRPLGQVFMEARVLDMARRALNRPYGGIIVAGATGAGKTSTLYAMLNERRLTRPDTHVTMVEEPIEYRLEGVTQVQVDASAGLHFANALRSMLRQDPDVIVVGEMRDSETARVGLEAAMTGHVLLTSLHANTALTAVQRLEELECSRPLISLSLALVLVQRLVRRLCSACQKNVEMPQALVDSLISRGVLPAGHGRGIPSPIGCDACGKNGFMGRIPVFEAMQLTDDIRQLLAAGAPLAEIQKIALETGALIPFAAYAGHLLRQGIISGSEALLTVAE